MDAGRQGEKKTHAKNDSSLLLNALARHSWTLPAF